MARKAVPPRATKRALIQAGTPIFDSVVADLQFDPAVPWAEPPLKPTPKTVATRVSRKTTRNPKVTV